MKKKILAALLVLASVTMMFTGCGSSGGKDQAAETDKTQVTIGFSSEPTSWDPCTGYGSTGPIIFSTLLEVNGKNELVNDLATEYKISDDALTWTYKIRDDAYFTDGEKLTAKDVAFTYNTTKDSASFVDLTMLDKATALDDTTVEFKLNKPTSTFAMTSAEIGIVPEHAYSADFGEKPIGSGA